QQLIQPLLQCEVGQVIGAEFVSEKGGKLFVLFDKAVLPIGAKDMMAVLDPLDDGGELAAKFFVQTGAKDHADLIGGEPPQSQLTTAFEDLVDREVALENEIAAVLDLRKSVEARWMAVLAFTVVELRIHT